MLLGAVVGIASSGSSTLGGHKELAAAQDAAALGTIMGPVGE
jgi:hypothetical protein